MALLKLHITLSGISTSTSAQVSEQKFNKLGWITPEWDDGSPGINKAKTLWDTYTYTDGCGNNIKYKGELAINGGTGIPGDPLYNPDYPQATYLRGLIDAGYDLANHSSRHRDGFPLEDTIELDSLIKTRVDYEFSTLVVPSNFNGYATAANSLHYKAVTSEGDAVFDQWIPVRIHKILPLNPVTTNEFFAMTRDFTDDWTNSSTVNFYKTQVDEFFTGARNYMILGTHSQLETDQLLSGFTDLYTYVRTTSTDRLLVCSLREMLDYREMRALPMTQSLSGNTLTITIDISTITERNRWRDISLNITSDKTITNVTGEGFSNVSFNPTTGLVNGFSQRTTWSGDVPPPDPNTMLVKHGKFTITV